MARKYGKKASEKVERTMHELKRGTLRTRAGKKVTSREQAIAIGLAQARRAGGKVPPPPRGHATMDLDARVRAEKDGLAVTSDGRWFGPAARGRAHSKMLHSPSRHHATKKKSPAQLEREIAEALSSKREDAQAHGYTFAEWLAAAGRDDSASEYDLRAAWRAGEDPADYEVLSGGRGRRSHATRRGAGVEVDTSVYRRYHGAEPRGFGNWTFVIGKREYAHSDDPALYRPAVARGGGQKAGRTGLPFARAKEYAIAEAKRRGATIVGVGP